MTAITGIWRRFFAEERDAYVLGLLRLAISALLFFNLLRTALEFDRDGFFGDYFHMPMIAEAWVPSRAGYQLLPLSLFTVESVDDGE